MGPKIRRGCCGVASSGSFPFGYAQGQDDSGNLLGQLQLQGPTAMASASAKAKADAGVFGKLGQNDKQKQKQKQKQNATATAEAGPPPSAKDDNQKNEGNTYSKTRATPTQK